MKNTIINHAIDLVNRTELYEEDKQMFIEGYKLLSKLSNDNFIDIPKYTGNFNVDGLYYDIPIEGTWYFDSYRRTMLLAVCCVKDGSRFYPLSINIENKKGTDVYELFISHQGKVDIPRTTILKIENGKVLEFVDISSKTLSSLVDERTLC